MSTYFAILSQLCEWVFQDGSKLDCDIIIKACECCEAQRRKIDGCKEGVGRRQLASTSTMKYPRSVVVRTSILMIFWTTTSCALSIHGLIM